MLRSIIMKRIGIILVIGLAAAVSISCSKKGEGSRYSIGNLLSASVSVISKKGIESFSMDEVIREIDRDSDSPDEILQKKSTIRQQNPDGSNNYRIIFEDKIEEERYNAARKEKDPFKE